MAPAISLDLGEAADRALAAGGLERLLAAVGARHLLRLVEQSALGHPHLRLHGPGQIALTSTPLAA